MSGELVLITGTSGHLGFRVLVEALEAGYRVRAPVRRSEQINAIKATKSVQPYLDNLELAIVPDILVDDAYDVVLAGVTSVIHVASPLAAPSDDYNRDIIIPAIKGTVGILTSALKFPTIKRVVITSSVNAIVSWEEITAPVTSKVLTDDAIIPKPQGHYNHYFAAYSASKVFARHATDDFVSKKHPTFDIINIMPSFIIGKNELVNSLSNIGSGTNAFSLAAIRGYQNAPNIGATVYLNDVAKVHVLALDEEKLPKQAEPIYDHFLTSSGGVDGTKFDDAIEIVKKNFPAQVEQGLWPLNGTQPAKRFPIDSSRTEKVFGIRFKGFEEQVKSVVRHYVELADKAGIKKAGDVVM